MKECRMVQWNEATIDKNGSLVCPECGEPAEQIQVRGHPCYHHIPRERPPVARPDQPTHAEFVQFMIETERELARLAREIAELKGETK